MEKPPTAIVCANDLLALGASNEAQSRDWLSVVTSVSPDLMTSCWAEYTHPSLTTLHQPAQEMGGMVAGHTTETRQQEPVEEPQIIIRPTLVVRESSGPAPT